MGDERVDGGGGGGGGYHRQPKYQNKFAFKHNPHSRRTLAIGALPATAGCCGRCCAIIEWKRKYRKYRPLTKPRKCTACALPRVKLAYHVLCGPCAEAKGRVCPKCLKTRAEADIEAARLQEVEREIAALAGVKGQIPGLSERERRSRLRALLKEQAQLQGGDEAAAEGGGGEDLDGGGDGDEGEGVGPDGGAGAGASAAAAPRAKAAIVLRPRARAAPADEVDDDGEFDDGEGEDDEDENGDAEEEEDEEATARTRASVLSGAKASASSATSTAPGSGAAPSYSRDSDGLFDAAVFSRALDQAARLRREMAGQGQGAPR